jgi:hypothetical protein
MFAAEMNILGDLCKVQDPNIFYIVGERTLEFLPVVVVLSRKVPKFQIQCLRFFDALTSCIQRTIIIGSSIQSRIWTVIPTDIGRPTACYW